MLWELDFSARVAVEAAPPGRSPSAAHGAASTSNGDRFRWFDATVADIDVETLAVLAPSRPDGFTTRLMRELELAEGWLAFGLIEPALHGKPLAGLNLLFSSTVMITVEFGHSETLAKLRQSWREDFQQFAQSPGFFLFEVSDHYTTVSQASLHHIETSIEALQAELFGGDANDNVFGATATLMQQLSEMRQHAVIAEETFEELATRSSTYISASTQPFIARNSTRMARLAAELLQQRDSLMSALNLYIGMTGHHTGQLLKRLTAFSMIFLPLGFVAGVFGMNFKYFPGLEWTYGYPMFWAIVAAITGALLAVARRGKWF